MRRSSITGDLAVEYNPFLRSPLWLEQTGVTLSVLSALTRLDIDPWQEAEALAALPSDDASARLSDLLAGLPGAQTVGDERDVVCHRSVSLLPTCHAPQDRSGQSASASNKTVNVLPPFIFLILGCMVAFGIVGSSLGPPASSAATAKGKPVLQTAAGPRLP